MFNARDNFCVCSGQDGDRCDVDVGGVGVGGRSWLWLNWRPLNALNVPFLRISTTSTTAWTWMTRWLLAKWQFVVWQLATKWLNYFDVQGTVWLMASQVCQGWILSMSKQNSSQWGTRVGPRFEKGCKTRMTFSLGHYTRLSWWFFKGKKYSNILVHWCKIRSWKSLLSPSFNIWNNGGVLSDQKSPAPSQAKYAYHAG